MQKYEDGGIIVLHKAGIGFREFVRWRNCLGEGRHHRRSTSGRSRMTTEREERQTPERAYIERWI